MPKKNNACFKIAIFTNRGNEERKKFKTRNQNCNNRTQTKG